MYIHKSPDEAGPKALSRSYAPIQGPNTANPLRSRALCVSERSQDALTGPKVVPENKRQAKRIDSVRGVNQGGTAPAKRTDWGTAPTGKIDWGKKGWYERPIQAAGFPTVREPAASL